MFLRVGACIPGPALAALGKVPAPYHLPSCQVGTDLRERACCLVGGDGRLLAGSRWTLTPGQSPRVPRVLQCPGPWLCVGVAGTQEQGRLSTARQHPRVLGIQTPGSRSSKAERSPHSSPTPHRRRMMIELVFWGAGLQLRAPPASCPPPRRAMRVSYLWTSAFASYLGAGPASGLWGSRERWASSRQSPGVRTRTVNGMGGLVRHCPDRASSGAICGDPTQS